jgi:hypothetical protein
MARKTLSKALCARVSYASSICSQARLINCEKFVTFHRLAGGEKPESFSFLFAETRDEILKDAIFCPPGPGERGRVNSRWGVLSGFLWLRAASNRSNHTLVVFTAVRLFITRADCLKWFDNRSQLGHVIALAVPSAGAVSPDVKFLRLRFYHYAAMGQSYAILG